MNNIGEKYLPLGTVVILKNAKKRLMITGFCAKDASNKENSEIFDYSGCMYPEGFLSSNQTALFNHTQIEKIYHMGLVDEEETMFKGKLQQLLEASNLISAQAPETILNQEEKQIDDSITSIPPIGPGLPGYVEPQPIEDDVLSVPPVGPGLPGYVAPQSEVDDIASIPPIGPGLPGYVEPMIEENKPQLDTNLINNIKFDENGVVIADFQFDTDN